MLAHQWAHLPDAHAYNMIRVDFERPPTVGQLNDTCRVTRTVDTPNPTARLVVTCSKE